MVKSKGRGGEGEDASPQPRQIAETTPSPYAKALSEGWAIEGMMQMQRALGELTAIVGLLKVASDRQSAKLDRISHIMFAAGVVLAIVLSIGGFFLNKIWDGVVALMNAPQ